MVDDISWSFAGAIVGAIVGAVVQVVGGSKWLRNANWMAGLATHRELVSERPRQLIRACYARAMRAIRE